MQRFAVVVAAASLLLAACGGSNPGSNSPGQSTASSKGPAAVTVKNFAFDPGNLAVKVGTKVTWKFEDTAQHNVTSDNSKFKSKDIQAGSYSYTFNSAGTYGYYCSIHQYMKGTITVH